MGLPDGYAEMHNYKHPKPVKLKLALFWVDGAGDPSAKLIKKADELLKPHNFSLEALPKLCFTKSATPFSDPGIPAKRAVTRTSCRMARTVPACIKRNL